MSVYAHKGVLTLSNPTGNVSYTVTGEPVSSGYTVSWTLSAGYYNNIAFISTDNGSTWQDMNQLGVTSLSNLTQVKFKATYNSSYGALGGITSSILSFGISPGESDNFILTQDVTDIQCFYAFP